MGGWSKCTHEVGECNARKATSSDASPLSPPHVLLPLSDSAQTEGKPAAIFLDRNADPYRDLLDILRAAPPALPYRLQAVSITVDAARASTTCCGSDTNTNANASCMAALRLQLRCRLHEVKAEAAWLGYASIVTLCERELSLV